MYSIVVILFAAVSINAATINRTLNAGNEKILTGVSERSGEKVSIDDAGYVGALRSISSNSTVGTVILIHNSWAITASDKVKDSLEDWEIRFGSSFSEDGGITRSIQIRVDAPKDSFYWANDISLVQLNEPVDVSYNVWTINIASGLELPINNNDVSLYTFGPDQGVIGGGYLRKFDLTFIDAANCRNRFPVAMALAKNNVCTNDINSELPENSLGSPLVYNGNLVGVFIGEMGTHGSEDSPNIYVDVTKYVEWIGDTLQDN